MTFNIVFWQNALSIHQAPFLKALAQHLPASGEARVVLNVERGIDSNRKTQGWTEPDYGGVRINIGSERPSVYEYGTQYQHVFSGFHETGFNHNALSDAIKLARRPFIILEAPRQDQLVRKPFRSLKYRFLAWRYRSADIAILPKGSMGVDYYKRHGFGHKEMQTFAYFPQALCNDELGPCPSRTGTKLLFVGQLCRRKNLGSVLALLADMKGLDWSFDVIGTGPLAENYHRFVEKNGLQGKVNFVGSVSNDEAQRRMSQSDYLVLPSLYDGWGAVVNESLLSGTPALVSSMAGSSCLIQDPILGAILDLTKPDQMLNVLKSSITNGPRSPLERDRIRRWAAMSISPDIGAQYFLNLIRAHHAHKHLTSVPVPWHSSCH